MPRIHRLTDLFLTDEAFEAGREQHCGECGALMNRWDGTRHQATLRVAKRDCGHMHYVPGGPLAPPLYCPEHCPALEQARERHQPDQSSDHELELADHGQHDAQDQRQ